MYQAVSCFLSSTACEQQADWCVQGALSGAQANGQPATPQDSPERTKGRQDRGSQASPAPQPVDSGDDASTAPFDPMEQPGADSVVALQQQLSTQSAQVEALKQVVNRLQAEVDQAGDRAEGSPAEAASSYSTQVGELQAQLRASHSRGQQLEGQLEAAAAATAAAQKRDAEMQAALEHRDQQGRDSAAADQTVPELEGAWMEQQDGSQAAAAKAEATASKLRQQLEQGRESRSQAEHELATIKALLSTEQAKLAAADGQAADLSQVVARHQQAASAAQAEVSNFREQLKQQQQELMATRQQQTISDEQAAQTQSELQATRCS